MASLPGVSYAALEFGLQNVAGNVAEMVQEPGIAKGGRWMQTASYQDWRSPSLSIGQP
jgi:hypothetical protein